MPKNPLASLQGLFYPKSIAVVGASDDISKIGGYIFSQVINTPNCKGYPINFKTQKVQGEKSYTSVAYLPKKVDLVIIAIPSQFVLEVVKDCGKKGIKNIVIISAGFKEVGAEGREKEEEMKQIINSYNINVIGPNCLGFLNTNHQLNASFAKELPYTGGISMVSQSGAIIDAILDWSFEYQIGFSKVVSIGNMAGVDELDMLNYLKNDSSTNAVVFYMESLEKGKEFAKALRETTKKKPVIIIKPGNSQNAQKAIGSHTGSLAQDGTLVEELIKSNNGILVKSIDELYNVLIALQSPLPQNDSVALVTNAGGPGVIATDALDDTSLTLGKISENTKKSMEKFLPKEASTNNPIDVLGDATSPRYKKTIETLAKRKEIGSIFVLLTPQIMTDSSKIAEEIVAISKNSSKPIFTSFLGGKELNEAYEVFKKNQIPHFSTPEQGIKALDYLHTYCDYNYKDKKITPQVDSSKVAKIRKELKNKEGLLPYSLSKKILSTVGVSLPKKYIFESRDDILKTTLPSHKTFLLKAEGITHKKEEGAIINNISSLNFHDEAIAMFSKFEKQQEFPQLTLEEEVKGHEIIVGLKSQGELGSFIMFGTGGSNVSIYNDIAFAPAPLSKKESTTLIDRVKISKLLKGYRGDKGVNMDSLEKLLVKLSYIQEFFPEIQEVDCNPIICNEKGFYLVDVKLVLSKNQK